MGFLYPSVICCMWATAQCWVLWILPQAVRRRKRIMHVESPLLGNIWNPNLMLGEKAAPLGPSRCVWGLMHLGHFTHPQTKIKHKLVTTVTKTGK